MNSFDERDLILLKSIRLRKVSEPNEVRDLLALQRLERYGLVTRKLGRFKVAKTSSEISQSLSRLGSGMIQSEELHLTASGLREYGNHFHPNGTRKL